MATKTNSIHKLGVAHKIERSRIWLEGKRLAAHGFTHYAQFSAAWGAGKLVLEIVKSKTAAQQIDNANLYKVAGSVERPIIDIVGQNVRDTFKGCTHVDVRWAQGKLVITGA